MDVIDKEAIKLTDQEQQGAPYGDQATTLMKHISANAFVVSWDLISKYNHVGVVFAIGFWYVV